MTDEKTLTAAPESEADQANTAPRTPASKKRRRRFGDRSDGRRLRSITPMNKLMPYIMPMRCDACNTYADMFDVTKTDKFCREKVKAGMTNFGFLHVMLAAYLRAISQRPGINRFISGQKIFARNEIVIVMTIKKTLSLDAPDTCIKVKFNADDTVDEVYEKFNRAVTEVQSQPDEKSDFDNFMGFMASLPGPILRLIVSIVKGLDYLGWLPKSFMDGLPFYGSMIITSMGSLGIRPIYHHIYNFGNLPVFLAYGGRRSVVTCDREGKVTTKKYIELKAVTDERITDGYYYASAFKLVKRCVENPELLEKKPEQIFEDVD